MAIKILLVLEFQDCAGCPLGDEDPFYNCPCERAERVTKRVALPYEKAVKLLETHDYAYKLVGAREAR